MKTTLNLGKNAKLISIRNGMRHKGFTLSNNQGISSGETSADSEVTLNNEGLGSKGFFNGQSGISKRIKFGCELFMQNLITVIFNQPKSIGQQVERVFFKFKDS